MQLNSIEVYDPEPYGSKKRLGRNNDGGYITIQEKNNYYDLFISCGISDDISFEIDFLKMYEGVVEKCIAFDGSIDELPEPCEKIEFIKKNISGEENEEIGLTNLHYLINSHNNIFLKMDIEGFEYPFFRSLDEVQMRNFKQIVIEFHHPFYNENNWKILNKIKETHWLVHLHPNNNCGTQTLSISTQNSSTSVSSITIPNVFECTYIRKPYLMLSKEKIPSYLDMPNVIDKEEISLNGYPYN